MGSSRLLLNKAMLFMLDREEGVDRITDPCLMRRRRHRRLHQFTERPMRTALTLMIADRNFRSIDTA